MCKGPVFVSLHVSQNINSFSVISLSVNCNKAHTNISHNKLQINPAVPEGSYIISEVEGPKFLLLSLGNWKEHINTYYIYNQNL